MSNNGPTANNLRVNALKYALSLLVKTPFSEIAKYTSARSYDTAAVAGQLIDVRIDLLEKLPASLSMTTDGGHTELVLGVCAQSSTLDGKLLDTTDFGVQIGSDGSILLSRQTLEVLVSQ